jgi:hypothetical protein
MGEKRKPCNVILLKKQGKKTNKVEMFSAHTMGKGYRLNRYRLRINGKWWPKGKEEYFTKTRVKELVFQSSFFE